MDLLNKFLMGMVTTSDHYVETIDLFSLFVKKHDRDSDGLISVNAFVSFIPCLLLPAVN